MTVRGSDKDVLSPRVRTELRRRTRFILQTNLTQSYLVRLDGETETEEDESGLVETLLRFQGEGGLI